MSQIERKRNWLRALRRQQRAQRQKRRGVLLLVVLSMLVLFMLLGTTFLITSSQSRTTSKQMEQAHRASLQPGDLMERAMMQVLRDTTNQHSSIRYHSLLRDMYGTDGFAGRVYAPNTGGAFGDPTDSGTPSTAYAAMPKYARSFTDNASGPLGPTAGQMIDLFIDSATLQTSAEQFQDANDEVTPSKLELDENGLPVVHLLPPTDGYYNGCLLTFTSGPARGQSTRIIDYDYVGDEPGFVTGGVPTPMFRLRVMAFGRTDGNSLTTRATGRLYEIEELVEERAIDTDPSAAINTVSKLFGHSFIVSGRPFNGTGVGYNSLAGIAAPRLTAWEAIRDASHTPIYEAEVALSPNARYLLAGYRRNPSSSAEANIYTGSIVSGTYQPINTFPTGAGAVPTGYTDYVGPGGPDESYDAPDFQNMFLAWQSLTPRSRGRVEIGGRRIRAEIDGAYIDDPNSPQAPNAPNRLDLEDLTIPSFHRPALANFWMQRLLNAPWLIAAESDAAVRARAILQPFGADYAPGGTGKNADPVPTNIAAQIVAVKRKMMLRPLPEDHPNFDGSNPSASVISKFNLNALNENQLILSTALGDQITFPFWEATGPWDVDNDGDGVPDSIWVDLGMPVQKTEDGRLYKPLFAILVQDMDGRLNLNAHGSADHFAQTDLDSSQLLPGGTSLKANLAGSDYQAILNGAANPQQFSTDRLPLGTGWGTGDITLRSFLSPNVASGNVGNILFDDYARLFGGRPATAPNGAVAYGRFGSVQRSSGGQVGAGILFERNITNGDTNLATLDPRSPIEFFGYPQFDRRVGETLLSVAPTAAIQSKLRFLGAGANNAFASVPDLRTRYATGLSNTGQPVSESASDINQWVTQVADSPYETNLMAGSRRDSAVNPYAAAVPVDDDALFSPGELERLLRAFDADAGRLPDRLWNLVDAFDPNKLTIQLSNTTTPSSGQLAQAQLQAEVNRRLVTTESFDAPVTNENWTDRLRFGADGLPGVAGVDDDGANGIDDLGELNFTGSDDYFAVTGNELPEQARLLDYLRYRVALELTRQGVAFTEADISNIVKGNNALPAGSTQTLASYGGLIAPEVLAGLKMNLNRPFGDGRDNNGNGIVDEELEAGEPWIDVDGDGRYSSATDTFLDLDGDGVFYADKDDNGVMDTLDLDGDGVFSPTVDSLWQNTVIATAIPFDHANGQDANGRGAYVGANPSQNIIRDDGRMARQLYARHLYCLAMLLKDENYLAPVDPTDAQAMHYCDPNSTGSMANQLKTAGGLTDAEARTAAMRKLTCRQIAQWAINCADMQDPDVIMTPFEYDENPWDGWNVVDGTNVYPLDGDLTTDENMGMYRNLQSGDLTDLQTRTTANIAQQTRGVVWGAERPELLMTEGLAWHDRRVEDLVTDKDTPPIDIPNNASDDEKENQQVPDDEELDQRLRPRGFAFIEIYNPQSDDGQLPAELYRDENQQSLIVDLANPSAAPFVGTERDITNPAQQKLVNGVRLDRLTPSNAGAQSFVWRMISVEEHPEVRNDDPWDDVSNASRRQWQVAATGIPSGYSPFRNSRGGQPIGSAKLAKPFDPDFPGFLRDYRPRLNSDSQIESQQMAYIEREFYFGDRTTATRIPTVGYQRIGGPPVIGGSGVNAQWFPPTSLFTSNQGLAPLMPGCRAIVGSSNYNYDLASDSNIEAGRYVTTVGRLSTADQTATGSGGEGVIGGGAPNGLIGRSIEDAGHIPDQTRRIELVPNRNPLLHQASVLDNGGREFRILAKNRSVTPHDPMEIESDRAYSRNVTDPRTDTLGTTNNSLIEWQQGVAGLFGDPNLNSANDLKQYNIRPVIAIPIEGMSLSTPVDDYARREESLAGRKIQQLPINGGGAIPPTSAIFWDPSAAKGEGSYLRQTGEGPQVAFFDQPFDMQDELIENHTTANYRTMHLQRLANPLLPWNPEPGRVGHDADKPVNPYLTVDSLPIDLTAINGTSSQESKISGAVGIGNDGTVVGGTSVRLIGPARHEQKRVLADSDGHTNRRLAPNMSFSSRQRGDTSNEPSRLVWAQPTRKPYAEIINEKLVLADRAIRPTGPPPLTGIPELSFQYDPLDTNSIRKIRVGGANNPANHIFDFPFRHSLGYATVRFDAEPSALQPDFENDYVRIDELYTSDLQDNEPDDSFDIATYNIDTNGDGIPGDLIGVPRTNSTNTPTADDSVYPWFAWNNRPFISAMELLQVPAASAGGMLREFSTFNNQLADQPNPYNGDIEANNDLTRAERLAATKAPFGHLLNFFQSSSAAATSGQARTGFFERGAPNFHRLMDYVHVPSRFIGTETYLNPTVFSDASATTITPGDPRAELQAPFNRVSQYREPGRVNLNTVAGQSEPVSRSSVGRKSAVYDGIMHRIEDRNPGTQLGHRGPAWRHVEMSRRGYIDPNVPSIQASPLVLNAEVPTFFGNPFRASDEGNFVPVQAMRVLGAESSLLRSHPFSPGNDGAWGNLDSNDNSAIDSVVDDALEAGLVGDDTINYDAATGGTGLPALVTAQATAQATRVPLFAAGTREPSLDSDRNSALRYMPLTRLSNLTSTRSGVFAVWITVGFFEVSPADPWTLSTGAANTPVQQRFSNNRELYDRVYPEGYQLGAELGSETGDTKRFRSFYLIDRTQPVAFKPGQDTNVEGAILLQRRIE